LAGHGAPWGWGGPGVQELGHLPVLQLEDQVVHGGRVMVGQHAAGVRRESPQGVVNDHPVDRAGALSRCQPPLHQPAVLGDLGAHSSLRVKPPILRALRARREVVAVVGQYGLFERRVLAGDVRRQVLARLLGGSGEERRHNVRPLLLWPAFPLCGPLEDLEVSLHVVFRSQLREAAGRGGGRRSTDGVLGQPQNSFAEQGEALGGLPLVLLGSQRRGSVRVLHGGVVVVGTE
jgi:hypothetical protein